MTKYVNPWKIRTTPVLRGYFGYTFVATNTQNGFTKRGWALSDRRAINAAWSALRQNLAESGITFREREAGKA